MKSIGIKGHKPLCVKKKSMSSTTERVNTHNQASMESTRHSQTCREHHSTARSFNRSTRFADADHSYFLSVNQETTI